LGRLTMRREFIAKLIGTTINANHTIRTHPLWEAACRLAADRYVQVLGDLQKRPMHVRLVPRYNNRRHNDLKTALDDACDYRDDLLRQYHGREDEKQKDYG
jgi:hypothetical protein